MKYLILLPFLAVSVAAQPAPDTSLAARVARLERAVGIAEFMSPPIPCSEMEAHRPTDELPNGSYNLAYSDKQLHCDANNVQRRLPPDGRTTAEYVNSAVSASRINAHFVGGLTVDSGDVLVKFGRVCAFYAGGGPSRLGSFPRVCTGGSQFLAGGEGASFSAMSNVAGFDGQSPRLHCADIQLAPDGGWRNRNNIPDMGPSCYDSQRPSGYGGFDSQSVFVLAPSIKNGEMFPVRLYRELFIHRNRATGFIEIATGEQGLQWQFTTSTGDRTFDKHVTIQTQQ